jgi:hypothetical protein
MKKLHLYLILILLLIPAAQSTIDYSTDRMNFPPGEPRIHQIDLHNNYNSTVIVNITFTPGASGFSDIGSNCGYPVAGLFNCIMPADSSKYAKIQSPSNCTEGTTYRVNITSNTSFSAQLTYVCIPDNKITDCKVEYGHGDANYLPDNQLYISNETATIFNLLRVWNIGHYLSPNENAINATVNCTYENYPVRTYGRVEITHQQNQVEGTFLWEEIEGGYWFRIGVVSQEVSGKSIGDYYNITCSELTYSFEHHTVIANSTTCDLEIRTQEPFVFTLENHPTDSDKSVLTITNSEEYNTYDISFDKLLDGVTHTETYRQLNSGQSTSYIIDKTTACNSTVFFIPSWFINSWHPQYYTQTLDCSGLNHPPTLSDIGNLTAYVNTTFTYDVNASDIDGDNITFYENTTLFDINNITGLISFTPNSSQVNNYSIEICVRDEHNTTDCETINLEVTEVIPSISAPQLYLALLDDNQTVQLNWTDVSADTYNIYFSPDPESFESTPNISGLTTTRWNDTTANSTKFRFYMVEAVKGPSTNESTNIGCKYDVFITNTTGTPGQIEGRMFGFPCNPFNTSIANLIRDPTDGDRIYRYNYTLSPPRYQSTRYFSALSGWFGDFSEFNVIYGYWFSPHAGESNMTIVGLAPEGNYSFNALNSTGTPGQIEGYLLDWNHYKIVCNVSTITRNPTDGDRIYRYNHTLSPPRYQSTRYFSALSDWFGDFSCMEPERSYWFSPSTNLTFEYTRLQR